MIIRLIPALVITLFFAAAQSFGTDTKNFVTISQYLTEHPHQQELMERFNSSVYSPAVPISGFESRRVKISVVYPALQQSNYWLSNIKAMEARLKELKVQYELVTYLSKPSGDSRLQALQIAEAVKSGSDYLAVSMDNESIKRLVSNIITRNRTKVFIQNLTTPVPQWQSSPPYLYVGFDHIKGSEILARHYSSLFPKGARYLLLYGAKGTVSEQRGTGFESHGLSRGLTPSAKFYTDFNSEKAYEAVKSSIIKGTDFSFIYACSTDVAIGAVRALKEAGLTGKIPVNGWGGTPAELELIRKGELDFTVMRMSDDSAVAIAEAIRNDITGNSVNTPQIFSGEFAVVTKEMTGEEIKQLEERAQRYSGN